MSSQDFGLPLGLRALAVRRNVLPTGAPFQPGGGTARLVSPGWVVWAKAPDKFEAGTPAIVNVIAFARALQLIQHFGKDAFLEADTEKRTAADILYHDELEKFTGRELLAELRQTLIGQRVSVPTVGGSRTFVNLDNGASTPTFEPIWDAVCQAWRQPEQVRQEIVREVKSIYGRKRIRLVALSGASNVLGVCNNLAEISRIVHRYGARLLVDAAQLVAHRKVDMEACGIDIPVFSAHKAYAPFGTGVLLVRKGLLHFSPAELERIQLSGEENTGGIVALGKALVLLQRIGLDVIREEEQALTGHALRGLAMIPGLTVFGITPDSPRFAQKGGVIVFRVEGRMASRVARELAEQGGIGVRSGCHCAHLLIKRLLHIPPQLELLQGLIVSLFPQVSLPGLTRISLGIENTVGEIDTLIDALGEIARQPAAEDNPFASKKTDIQRRMDDFARTAAQRVYTQPR